MVPGQQKPHLFLVKHARDVPPLMELCTKADSKLRAVRKGVLFTGKPRESHGKTIGKWGKTLGKPDETHGKMGKT